LVKASERPLQMPDVSDLKGYAQTISTLCIRDWSVENDGAIDGRFLGNGSAQEPVALSRGSREEVRSFNHVAFTQALAHQRYRAAEAITRRSTTPKDSGGGAGRLAFSSAHTR
jgi:hypothetical protein